MKNKICENCGEKFIPEFLVADQTFCMKCLKASEKILDSSMGFGEPNGEEYAIIKEMKERTRGYEIPYMDKVYQLIDVLIKKGVITIEDLNGYKKLKNLKEEMKKLDEKLSKKFPIKLQE